MSRMDGLALTRARMFALAMLATLVLASCQTVQTTQPGAVGVERQQSMLLSASQVDKSAVQAYQQEMKKASAKNLLNHDAAQVTRVKTVAQRLIPATAAFRSDAPKWAWEVNVITSGDVNAWCMPGGKMAVYTGLIDKLKITDDELAAVMGHEIAHALREHGRERMSQAYADAVGLELAARAGYDPRAAVTLWQKMGQVGGGAPPQFLSTHPSPQNRASDLTNYATRVMPLYEAARKR